jgi:hypothetical protein
VFFVVLFAVAEFAFGAKPVPVPKSLSPLLVIENKKGQWFVNYKPSPKYWGVSHLVYSLDTKGMEGTHAEHFSVLLDSKDISINVTKIVKGNTGFFNMYEMQGRTMADYQSDEPEAEEPSFEYMVQSNVAIQYPLTSGKAVKVDLNINDGNSLPMKKNGKVSFHLVDLAGDPIKFIYKMTPSEMPLKLGRVQGTLTVYSEKDLKDAFIAIKDVIK